MQKTATCENPPHAWEWVTDQLKDRTVKVIVSRCTKCAVQRREYRDVFTGQPMTSPNYSRRTL